MGMQAAGMGANIAGSEMQRWAAILEADAMAKAFGQQMHAQQGFRNQSLGQLSAYLPSLSAENAQRTMDGAVNAREQAYRSGGQLVAGSSPDQSVLDALALQGAQRAKLGAYGDWQTGQSIGATHEQDLLNRIASRAHGSASVFPYKMYSAQHSMDWLSALGQMVAGLGGASTNFGALYTQGQPSLQSSGSPSASQMSAFNMGYGPVNQQSANGINQAYSGVMYPNSVMYGY